MPISRKISLGQVIPPTKRAPVEVEVIPVGDDSTKGNVDSRFRRDNDIAVTEIRRTINVDPPRARVRVLEGKSLRKFLRDGASVYTYVVMQSLTGCRLNYGDADRVYLVAEKRRMEEEGKYLGGNPRQGDAGARRSEPRKLLPLRKLLSPPARR